MNVGHKLGCLRNRLARLKKKISDAGADRKGAITARIAEIEEILRKATKS
jgi:transcription elongation GreA/GreB family factor